MDTHVDTCNVRDRLMARSSPAADGHSRPLTVSGRRREASSLSVGERVHTYLVELRVSHACRLLVSTNQQVKTIAAASGFPRAQGMASALHTHVGVSPKVYRRIFARP